MDKLHIITTVEKLEQASEYIKANLESVRRVATLPAPWIGYIKEEWKDIAGYEGYYQVSNLGRVRSLDRVYMSNKGLKRKYRGSIIKSRDNSGGYLQITLCNSAGRKYPYVHRLVCEAFHGIPTKDKKQVNHKNGIKSDNKYTNLEWVSPLNNTKHSIDTGLRNNKGSMSPRARSVVNCRGFKFSTVLEASNFYNTNSSNISAACRGRQYTAGKYSDGSKIKWRYNDRG